jgi:OOP family OmpA-OmpF porin
MKIIFTTLTFLFISCSLFGQKSPNSYLKRKKNYFTTNSLNRSLNNSNGFSIGLNYGFHGSLDAFSSINPSSSDNVLFSARYFFNPYCGINLKLGFDRFNAKNESLTLTNYADAYLDVFYDLGKVLDFQSVNYNINKQASMFQLFIHGGPGVSTMWHNDYNSNNASDPYFKNQDDMLNFNVGIMPELKLSEQFSMNLDFTVVNNFLQDRAFNYSTQNISQKSKMYTLLVGINYFF